MNGKGDKQRPLKVDAAKFESNWDAIFGKDRKDMPTNEQIEMVFHDAEGKELKKEPPEGG